MVKEYDNRLWVNKDTINVEIKTGEDFYCDLKFKKVHSNLELYLVMQG